MPEDEQQALLPGAAAASASPEPEPEPEPEAEVDFSAPPSPGTLIISVAFEVHSFQVDTSTGSEVLRLKFLYWLEWDDPRVAELPGDELPPNLWKPGHVFETPFTVDDSGKLSKPSRHAKEGERTRLQCCIEAEETEVEMGIDAKPLRVFPFDTRRVDFFVCISQAPRWETQKDYKLRMDVRTDKGTLYQMGWTCNTTVRPQSSLRLLRETSGPKLLHSTASSN